MRLILCDAGDPSAAWVHQGLAARGIAVELVTADQLLIGAVWQHRLHDGRVTTTVDLADGRVLSSSATTTVLNRLTAPPVWALPRVTAADREYALGELMALWTSWVASLPRVLGRPAAGSLAGPVLHGAQWTLLAGQAGLRTRPWRARADPARGVAHMDPDVAADRGATVLILVAGAAIVGPPVPSQVVRACRALAAATDASMLGVALTPSLVFRTATPVPDLRRGGGALLDVLAEAMA